MKKVIFETEEAVFQFDRKDVKRHLKFLEAEHGIEEVTKLLEFISASSKTYLACALANRACLMGLPAFYIRIPKLFQDLALAKADGSYSMIMKKLTRSKVLVLDDLGLAPLNAQEIGGRLQRNSQGGKAF